MLHDLSKFTAASLIAFSALGAGAGLAADQASAELYNREGDPIGEAQLTDTSNGVIIDLRIENLAAGTYAFHIHETGVCEAPFRTAGGHLNPLDAEHGFLDGESYHLGDLPNIHVGEAGLRVEVFASGATLRPGDDGTLMDDDGAALVLHAGPDDYATDPAGAAGERIACGVVISQT